MRTSVLLAFFLQSVLLGCIENPTPDPRLHGGDRTADQSDDQPVAPVPDEPAAQNLSLLVNFENAKVRFSLIKANQPGVWTLTAKNLTNVEAFKSTLLVQCAFPTSPDFGDPDGPDFFDAPFHEEILRIPDLKPGVRITVKDILLEPQLVASDIYLKVVHLGENAVSGEGPFSASGLYSGDYWMRFGDSLTKVGTVKGVIDASGRLGFLLTSIREPVSKGILVGAYRAGAAEALDFLSIFFGASNEFRDVPVMAWRRETYGYALRIAGPEEDSVEIRFQRVQPMLD